MKLLKKILPQTFKIFLIEHRYMFSEIRKKHKKYLNELILENREKSLPIDDEQKWIKKLNKLTYADPSLIELGASFATSKIEIVRNIEIKTTDIIAICVEKNDILKLKKFILHHRKIGIDKFVILDNNSNDGTIEWLLEQEDVLILKTEIPYSSINRVAWINRIIAYLGDNRWYFVADSDELLFYNECESKIIQDVVKYCENSKIKRARAIMIDMYAKPEYYISNNIEKYFEECVYFDTDTYYLDKRENFIHICGGPRERVFNMTPCLTKYPLFYFRKKDIHCRSHLLYPYQDNFKSDCQLILKHYKFLPSEIEKYRKIVEYGNYYKGSWAYKEYLKVMEHTNKLNFMYENTCGYENSSSLDNISEYKKINWNTRRT